MSWVEESMRSDAPDGGTTEKAVVCGRAPYDDADRLLKTVCSLFGIERVKSQGFYMELRRWSWARVKYDLSGSPYSLYQ